MFPIDFFLFLFFLLSLVLVLACVHVFIFISDVPKMIGKLKNVEVNAGEPIILFAEFLGSPYPTAKWFKTVMVPARKTTELESEKRITIQSTNKNSELVIDPSVRPDKGNYTIQLTNFLKTVEIECTVEVLG